MPRRVVSFAIDGGYNSEMGPSAPFAQRQDGRVSVPFLALCENAIFNLDGWPQKMPGASNVNSVATGATDSVMGIFDYWRSTASGDPTQQRIIYAGSQIYSETGGTLTSRKTGLETGKMPAFEVMNDNLVMASTSNVDVPFTWDQTTFANLGGSPPNFAFHREYKDRMFAAGVDTNKSRLYYTISGNEANWNGAGSGSIDIAPNDGDVITALAYHKNELLVFKGPNKNSLHRITGSAPTGSDAYVQSLYFSGVGSTNHQNLVSLADDLVFWDDMGIHSLVATAAYGNYNAKFLSSDIHTYFTKSLNHSRMSFVWGANFATAGYALWTASLSGSSTNNVIVLMDYRFAPMRFSVWPAYAVASLGMVRDSSREVVPWCGTYTGFVRRMNRAARDLGGTAFTMKARLPYLDFGDAFYDKTVTKGRLSLAPKGATTATIGYQRDGNTQQTVSVNQTGTSTLGASSDQFTLGSATSGVLAGGRYIPQFFDMEGQFKELQIEMSQGTVDVDFEPHGLAVEVEGDGIGTVGTLG